jgi:glycosyltransferase involved in cell wall biosynthesis
MKTAIIHDWLVGIAGGEKVLEEIYSLYPSKIFTMIYDSSSFKGSLLASAEVKASWLSRLPGVKRYYRSLLPFFPLAVEQFDLRGYDVVISSSHAVAKGVITTADQLHICYCHSPMRYAWDLYPFHRQELKGLKKIIAEYILHKMRLWDFASAQRVDAFIANSKHVARRIKKTYGKDADVIYPPVDTKAFVASSMKEDYYVVIARLVPYKKVDIIVDAFTAAPHRRLVVIGDGPEMGHIKKRAGKNIEMAGHLAVDRLRSLLSSARGFVFAAEEDFGIVMAEALAAGTPVIAYGRGGALEIVEEGRTGTFFSEQTPEAINNALAHFEAMDLDATYIRTSAERFSKENFHRQLYALVEKKKGQLRG